MKRRQYLAGAGSAGMALLAGCNSPAEYGDDNKTDGDHTGLEETVERNLTSDEKAQNCDEVYVLETDSETVEVKDGDETTYLELEAVAPEKNSGDGVHYRVHIAEYEDPNKDELETKHIVQGREGSYETSNQFDWEVEDVIGTNHSEQEGVMGISLENC